MAVYIKRSAFSGKVLLINTGCLAIDITDIRAVRCEEPRPGGSFCNSEIYVKGVESPYQVPKAEADLAFLVLQGIAYENGDTVESALERQKTESQEEE